MLSTEKTIRGAGGAKGATSRLRGLRSCARAGAVRATRGRESDTLVTVLREGLETRDGDQVLITDLYVQLRRIAAKLFQSERPDHTLQPTALANEAYLRLALSRTQQWDSRAHFFSSAAQAMRQILIDHARKARTLKRRGALHRVELTEEVAIAPSSPETILAVNAAVQQLKRVNERQAEIVELRFFAGLTVAEVAEILGLGVSTVKTDWFKARTWLERELSALR